jgi:hypothetical protein
VGQFQEGGVAAIGLKEELIGADEVAADVMAAIGAADTIPLDEATLRAIFGGEDPDSK